AVAGTAAAEENDLSPLTCRELRGVFHPELHKRSRNEKGAADIDAQGTREFVGIELPEIAGLAEFRGGMNNGIEAAPLAPDFREYRSHGISVGDIETRRAMVGTELACRFVDFVVGRPQPKLVARSGEVAGHFEADAAAAAGYEDTARLRRMCNG